MWLRPRSVDRSSSFWPTVVDWFVDAGEEWTAVPLRVTYLRLMVSAMQLLPPTLVEKKKIAAALLEDFPASPFCPVNVQQGVFRLTLTELNLLCADLLLDLVPQTCCQQVAMVLHAAAGAAGKSAELVPAIVRALAKLLETEDTDLPGAFDIVGVLADVDRPSSAIAVSPLVAALAGLQVDVPPALERSRSTD